MTRLAAFDRPGGAVRVGHDGRVRIIDRWSARTATALSADHVFRPPVGVWVSGVWVVVTILWFIGAAASGGRSLLFQLPVMTLTATLVYATCTRPLVAVGPDGVLLRNLVRDVSVPWAALERVDTRYALTLTAGGRRYAAWAAPAPSRFTTTRATPGDLRTLAWDDADGPIPASATLRSDAGAAAALIRRYWSPSDVARSGAGAVRVRWAVGVLAALGGSLALTLLGLTLA